ncbi:hypothetical protein [Blastococcus mobilis]|uniref:Uncharacterized protein n=1 Tax=Blastococcus mobilis TaxID=1938746 RepID=A0A238ZGQ6_9ACTN|nr:hypothetical protein [Blastococcus mobilis]SNR81854.1 hypothetical protein SAMN06272737_12823 [Blastococcus mobilis]
MARGIRLVRSIGVAICAAVVLVVNGNAALACDTGSWLAIEGPADSGDLVTIRGGGFSPGGVTLVWDRSAGQVLGHAPVAPDGSVTARIEIPDDAAGTHKVIAVASGRDESPVGTHAWTDVVIPTAATEQPTRAVPSARGAATGQQTADDAAPGPLEVGLGALAVAAVAGFGFLLRLRRRADGVPVGDGPDDLDVELLVLVAERQDDRAGDERASAARIG